MLSKAARKEYVSGESLAFIGVMLKKYRGDYTLQSTRLGYTVQVPAESVEERDESEPLKKKLKSVTMPNVTVRDLIEGRPHQEFCMVKATMEPFTEDIHRAAKLRIRHRAAPNLNWFK